MNNVPLDEVTKAMRYAAKEVNFGVLYGMGAYGLAWRGIHSGRRRNLSKNILSGFPE